MNPLDEASEPEPTKDLLEEYQNVVRDSDDLLKQHANATSTPSPPPSPPPPTSNPFSRNSFSRISLGDELLPFQAPAPTATKRSREHLPRRETVLSVVRKKIQVQLGMAAIQTLPLGRKLAHSVLRVLAEATAETNENGDDARPFERDWIEHVEISGKAGEIKPAILSPQVAFQIEQLALMDTFAERGRGTRLLGYTIGAEPQISAGDGIWTASLANFPHRALVHTPGLRVTFLVAFVEDCTWEATLFGKMVPELDLA